MLWLMAAGMMTVAFRPSWNASLLAIVTMEMLLFVHATSAESPLKAANYPPEWDQAVAQLGPGQRALITYLPASNLPLTNRFPGVWGYDPNGLRRWAEFMFASQGRSPSEADQYLQIRKLNLPFFQLAACQYALTMSPQSPVMVIPDPLPFATLIGDVRVVKDRDSILSAMGAGDFNPRQQVYLEQAPSVHVQPNSSPGSITALAITSDEWDVKATVSQPVICLISQSYDPGWHVESIETSAQASYEVMPANWALQAIPLSSGSHHFRLVYTPLGYRLGQWVSALSLVCFLAWTLIVIRPIVLRHKSEGQACAAASDA